MTIARPLPAPWDTPISSKVQKLQQLQTSFPISRQIKFTERNLELQSHLPSPSLSLEIPRNYSHQNAWNRKKLPSVLGPLGGSLPARPWAGIATTGAKSNLYFPEGNLPTRQTTTLCATSRTEIFPSFNALLHHYRCSTWISPSPSRHHNPE